MEKDKFLQIPYVLLKNKELKDGDKILLAIILGFNNNKKKCYMSNSMFANMLGISRTSASERITKLENLGYINCKRETIDNKTKRVISVIHLEQVVGKPNTLVGKPNTLVGKPTTTGRNSEHLVVGEVGTTILDILDYKLDKLSNNLLDKEKLELNEFEKNNLIKTLKDILAPEEVKEKVELLITGGIDCLTIKNKELILANKKYFNKGTLLPKVIAQLE